jgi:hypothetical protein
VVSQPGRLSIGSSVAWTLRLEAVAKLVVAHHRGHTFVVGCVTTLTHPDRPV